jgi:2-dehydropantoate 2-reductase
MAIKILVVGIGGVGGYYGGMLAKNNIYNSDVEIYFMARGNHLKTIQQIGLTVKTDSGVFMAQPKLATDKAEKTGVVDYVILATKSYDLEESIEQIKPCISKNTVILPLLNGIDITPRIRKVLPDNEVWYGCVYIVGRIAGNGVVNISGNVNSLIFGNTKLNDKQQWFEKFLKESKIRATLSEKILTDAWQKYAFISSTASLTSYFDCSFRDLLKEKYYDELIAMLNELLQVAKAEKAELDESVIEKIVRRIETISLSATSSMHSDFKAKKRTEVDSLTGVVIQLSQKHGIEVPVYEKVYAALKKKDPLPYSNLDVEII